MFRECAPLLVAILATCPACSLILDFDSALPVDAAVDAPYTQDECDFSEPNDELAAATMIGVGNTGPGAICAPVSGNPEDRDFYKFMATGGQATLMLAFTNRVGGDLDLKLYDATGTMIASSRGFGSGETIVCMGAAPLCPALMANMIYTLEVFPGVAGSVNNYTLSITQ